MIIILNRFSYFNPGALISGKQHNSRCIFSSTLSTDIPVLLQMLLGLGQPIYTFHKLLLGDDGHKLSKSKGSPTLRSLREEGWTAAEVRAAVGF